MTSNEGLGFPAIPRAVRTSTDELRRQGELIETLRQRNLDLAGFSSVDPAGNLLFAPDDVWGLLYPIMPVPMGIVPVQNTGVNSSTTPRMMNVGKFSVVSRRIELTYSWRLDIYSGTPTGRWEVRVNLPFRQTGTNPTTGVPTGDPEITATVDTFTATSNPGGTDIFNPALRTVAFNWDSVPAAAIQGSRLYGRTAEIQLWHWVSVGTSGFDSTSAQIRTCNQIPYE